VAKSQTNSKSAVSPRQLLVIGVLGVILAAVLIMQLSGEPAASPAATDPKAAGPLRPAAKQPTPADPAAARESKSAWPKAALAEVVGHDPFAVRDTLVVKKGPEEKKDQAQKKKQENARRKQERDQALAALRRRGASTVFVGPQGAAAVVGPRVVRVGDELDGYRVVSIDNEGVLLAPSNPQDAREEQQ
jgi:hypothetical protein